MFSPSIKRNSKEKGKNSQDKMYQAILKNMKEKLKRILSTLENYKKVTNDKKVLIVDIDERIDYLAKKIKEIDRLFVMIK